VIISAFLAGSVITDWLSSRRFFLFSDEYAITGEDADLAGGRRSSIGKVMMLYGNPTPVYERALKGHNRHNEMHGYSMHVLREQTLSEFWSKPAYVLQVLLAELAKPAPERLKWLVCVYPWTCFEHFKLTFFSCTQLARWRSRYNEPQYSARDIPPSGAGMVTYQRTCYERSPRSQQRRLLPPSK
jgi:hypothetical protein